MDGARSKWQVTFLTPIFILGKELIEFLASFASLGPNASSRLPRLRMRPENRPAARSLARRKAQSRVGPICLAGLLALAGDAASADLRGANATQSSAVTVDLKKASHPPTSVEKQIEKLDPNVDGWDTEAFNDAVAVPLRALTGVIEHPRKVDASALRPFLTGDFGCQALRPEKLKTVYDDGAFRVTRVEDAVEKFLQPSITDNAGAEGLLAALKQLTDALVDMEALHCKFKQFQVEKSGALLVTRILYEASGHNAQGSIQQNATWRCQWAQPQAGGAPRLKWIGLERYEEVSLKCPGGQWFVDCTASALGGNRCYEQDILPGIGDWLGRITRLEGISRYGHHGIAVGDVNNDGLEDLYFCNAGGLPNHLFIQNPDGTVTDRAAEWGVDWLENCVSVLLVDLDNDGYQDLVVAAAARLLVAQNDGQGHFKLRWSSGAVVDPMSLCAADFDNDGDLDIYVCGYMATPGAQRIFSPVPYHDANNGGRNALFRNDGNFHFTDVTEATGLDVNNRRFSFAASWEDFDNDGWMDLYVANDFGRHNLYRNDHGHFTDIAAAAGVEDIGAGMSVSWGDFNRDGLMDLYVANMFSSAGSRIAYQPKFAHSQFEAVVKTMQRMARGNTLFQNAGDGHFRDVSEDTGVTMGRWAWASKFVDLNNDGWPDLAIANGYITGEDPRDL